MILDKKKILEFQKNRDPYLMIDHVDEVQPGVMARGYKKLSKNEWFFDVHWPGDPNMPGALQLESLMQMASIAILTLPEKKGKLLYLTNVDNMKLTKKVVPENKMIINTKIISFKRGLAICEGETEVNGQSACKAKFKLILPDEINKYKI